MSDAFVTAACSLAEAVLADAGAFRAFMVANEYYEAADALDAVIEA